MTCNAITEVGRFVADLRLRESGLTEADADLIEDLERWLLEADAHRMENEDGHRDYRYKEGPKKGRRMPGNTSIIGQNLGWGREPIARWAAKKAAEECAANLLEGADPAAAIQRARFAPFSMRDDAGGVGTLAHAKIMAHVNNVPFDDDPFDPSATIKAADERLAKFVKWWNPEIWEVMATELPLTDEVAGYGGTIDMVLRRRVDGAVIVGDIKTGNSLHDEVFVQLGGYAALLMRRKPEWMPIGGGLAIHVPPEGDTRAVSISLDRLTLGTQAFAALLMLHAARKHLTIDDDKETT